jgi:hypothetical protein
MVDKVIAISRNKITGRTGVLAAGALNRDRQCSSIVAGTSLKFPAEAAAPTQNKDLQEAEDHHLQPACLSAIGGGHR